MTKQEFLDWRRSEVTQTVFAILQDRIDGLQEELGVQAGVDPLQDRSKVGAIAALKDILAITIDDISEDETDD